VLKNDKDGLDVLAVADGVTQMSFAGADTDLTWTMTKAGAAFERGAVGSERVLYMVSGRMRLTVGSETTELVAAEMVVIPAGASASSVTSDEESVDLTIGRPA
jgi:mannose-6-phosphate isomerase-like protein (cupin superfamily)